MRRIFNLSAIAAMIGILAMEVILAYVDAETSGHAIGNHPATTQPAVTTLPREPGQSAFAATSEIVEIINRDPNTEWRHVDIDALHQHLIDMNELLLNAQAKVTEQAGRIVFSVQGAGGTLRAIHAMVPAHAAALPKSTDWKATANKTDNGAVLTIAAKGSAELVKIRALGFFGVMATGAHHQEHHLRMALGSSHDH